MQVTGLGLDIVLQVRFGLVELCSVLQGSCEGDFGKQEYSWVFDGGKTTGTFDFGTFLLQLALYLSIPISLTLKMAMSLPLIGPPPLLILKFGCRTIS